MGVGNLAHLRKRTLFFHYQQGLKPEQGADPPLSPHFNQWVPLDHIGVSIVTP